MTEYDINELNTEFADFRTATAAHVHPAGIEAARSTVRRRRKVRTLALSALAVLVVAPVAAYAALAPEGSSPPVAVASSSAATSPSLSASAPPSPSAAPSPSITARTSPSAKATGTRHTLGPTGFGPLRFGMTEDQAYATGLIEERDTERWDCTPLARLRGAVPSSSDDHYGMVWFREGVGVVDIYAYPGVLTPEGIGIGASYAKMKRAYPTWQSVSEEPGSHDGRGHVPVPGNDAAKYRIVVSNGKVVELNMYLGTTCYE